MLKKLGLLGAIKEEQKFTSENCKRKHHEDQKKTLKGTQLELFHGQKN